MPTVLRVVVTKAEESLLSNSATAAHEAWK
jgi:hypothetical protein